MSSGAIFQQLFYVRILRRIAASHVKTLRPGTMVGVRLISNLEMNGLSMRIVTYDFLLLDTIFFSIV